MRSKRWNLSSSENRPSNVKSPWQSNSYCQRNSYSEWPRRRGQRRTNRKSKEIRHIKRTSAAADRRIEPDSAKNAAAALRHASYSCKYSRIGIARWPRIRRVRLIRQRRGWRRFRSCKSSRWNFIFRSVDRSARSEYCRNDENARKQRHVSGHDFWILRLLQTKETDFAADFSSNSLFLPENARAFVQTWRQRRQRRDGH